MRRTCCRAHLDRVTRRFQLAEAQMVAVLCPAHNRVPKSRAADSRGAPWPYAGAIAIEERDAAMGERAWHVIDVWCYLGTASTLAEARALRPADDASPSFQLAVFRILSEKLARGLAVTPLGLASPLVSVV